MTVLKFSRDSIRNDFTTVGIPAILAGDVSDGPDANAEYVARWEIAAYAAAYRLGVTIAVAEYPINDPTLAVTHDEDGDLTVAGQIWQAAHDATPLT